jgi:hypothetical protein
VYWTDTADGHHCTRHDFAFQRGEVCHECVTDPGDAPGQQIDDPEYQRLLCARVNEYRCNARAARRRAEELYRASEWSCAAKFEDTAIKWARLAEEQQGSLDGRAHDLKLIRHEEVMSGQRKGN